MKSNKQTDNTILVKNTLDPKITNYELSPQKIAASPFSLIGFEIEKDTNKIKREEVETVKTLYGQAQYRLLEKDINNTNGILGVINSITARVPSIKYTPKGFIIRGGSITITLSRIALMLIDGLPNNNFESLDPNNIRKIEIVSGLAHMYGDQGKNGIISIFLKNKITQDNPLDANNIKLNIKGYEIAEVFDPGKIITIDKTQNIPTFYWNPEILSDEKGECFIELPVRKRPFKIVIEGVSQNNIPFRKEEIIR